MKKRVKDEEQKSAIQLNYFLEMVPNNPQLPKVPRKSDHRESKGPKRHLGWWRRQGLTIFKNEKLLTFHLAHLYKI